MYTEKINAIVQNGTLAELDLSSTGVAGPNWLVMSKITIHRLLAVVSTVFSSSTNAVITFRSRPTYGSSGGQTTIGTLKLGTSAGVGTVGKVYYNNITPVAVNPGTQIVTDVTTAVTSSGKAICSFEARESTEEAADSTTMANTP